METKFKELNTVMKACLDLKNEIIGVKFLKTKEDYDKSESAPLEGKMYYCVMVRAAMKGKIFKVNKANFSCLHSARTLGVDKSIDPDRLNKVINRGFTKDINSANRYLEAMTQVEDEYYGMELAPLKDFKENPDVIIIVTIPYNAMRVVEGYVYSNGTYSGYKMCGYAGICSESTAYPWESDEINISMLCSGTRCFAKWDKEELGIGIPYSKFESVVSGIFNTVNIIELNDDKIRIQKQMKKDNIELDIEFNKTYYLGH